MVSKEEMEYVYTRGNELALALRHIFHLDRDNLAYRSDLFNLSKRFHDHFPPDIVPVVTYLANVWLAIDRCLHPMEGHPSLPPTKSQLLISSFHFHVEPISRFLHPMHHSYGQHHLPPPMNYNGYGNNGFLQLPPMNYSSFHNNMPPSHVHHVQQPMSQEPDEDEKEQVEKNIILDLEMKTEMEIKTEMDMDMSTEMKLEMSTDILEMQLAEAAGREDEVSSLEMDAGLVVLKLEEVAIDRSETVAQVESIREEEESEELHPVKDAFNFFSGQTLVEGLGSPERKTKVHNKHGSIGQLSPCLQSTKMTHVVEERSVKDPHATSALKALLNIESSTNVTKEPVKMEENVEIVVMVPTPVKAERRVDLAPKSAKVERRTKVAPTSTKAERRTELVPDKLERRVELAPTPVERRVDLDRDTFHGFTKSVIQRFEVETSTTIVFPPTDSYFFVIKGENASKVSTASKRLLQFEKTCREKTETPVVDVNVDDNQLNHENEVAVKKTPRRKAAKKNKDGTEKDQESGGAVKSKDNVPKNREGSSAKPKENVIKKEVVAVVQSKEDIRKAYRAHGFDDRSVNALLALPEHEMAQIMHNFDHKRAPLKNPSGWLRRACSMDKNENLTRKKNNTRRRKSSAKVNVVKESDVPELETLSDSEEDNNQRDHEGVPPIPLTKTDPVWEAALPVAPSRVDTTTRKKTVGSIGQKASTRNNTSWADSPPTVTGSNSGSRDQEWSLFQKR